VRIFKTAWFGRFAQVRDIPDALLREAVERAERGSVDARLGRGVLKQRIPRVGSGRSGGYRAIVLLRPGERAFFVYGYAKSDRSDLRPDEVAQFKHMARHVLGLTDDQLAALVARGDFEEVGVHE
jgi:hypothetical protein